jgi:prephenate dehydrogenase
MWRDILLANRVPIAAALREFLGKLEGIRTAIEQGDAPAISRWLADGKRRRDGWLNQRKNNPSE